MSTTANMETLTRQIILAGFVLMFSSPIAFGQPIRISDGPVFDKVILPILQEKCMSCHGPDKAKGKLRLHSREFIEAADGLIEPHDLEASELVYRVSLPLNDPDDEKMPPSGEPNQLTQDEIWLLKWWVANGADYTKKLSEVENTDDARQPLLRTLRYYAIFPPGTGNLLTAEPEPENEPEPGAPPPGATAQKGPRTWGSIYEEVIDPLLEHNCGKCHGEGRKSANLRLHNPEGIREGGKNGPPLVAGNPRGSLMMQRIHLPAGDDDRMPPTEENRQLAPDEIRLIEWWIQSGARFDQPLSNAPANMVPTMKKVIDVAETRRNSRVGATGGPKVAAADGGALQAVKDFGVNVLPVTKGSNALAIHCDDMASEINDDALKHIAQVGPQVVWLNLAKTRVTDAGLATLAQFLELRRLHLDRTRISDAAITHISRLPKLEYLNLVSTSLSDTGLRQLAVMPAIQKIYAGQTKVTQGGVDQAKASKPGLEINAGFLAIPDEPAPGGIGAVVGAGGASAQVDPTPVNTQCPVTNTRADQNRTTVFNNMTIAFSNGQALARFNDNPAQYVNRLVITRQPNNAAAAPKKPVVAPPGTPPFGRDAKAFVQQYCGNCHANGSARGGIALGGANNSTDVLRDRKTWNLAASLVSEGEMPPQNRQQPSAREAKEFTDLIRSIFEHADKNPAKPKANGGAQPGAQPNMAKVNVDFGPRTWTRNDGRKVEGKLYAADNAVAIITISGRNYNIPLNTLSPEDQQYIQQWRSAKGV